MPHATPTLLLCRALFLRITRMLNGWKRYSQLHISLVALLTHDADLYVFRRLDRSRAEIS